MLSESPCKLFGIEKRGYIHTAEERLKNIASVAIPIFNSNDWIASNCKWTPFHGWKIKATPCGTIVNGNVSVWDEKLVEQKFGKPLDGLSDLLLLKDFFLFLFHFI